MPGTERPPLAENADRTPRKLPSAEAGSLTQEHPRGAENHPKGQARHQPPLTPQRMMQLQRTIGNRAASRLAAESGYAPRPRPTKVTAAVEQSTIPSTAISQQEIITPPAAPIQSTQQPAVQRLSAAEIAQNKQQIDEQIAALRATHAAAVAYMDTLDMPQVDLRERFDDAEDPGQGQAVTLEQLRDYFHAIGEFIFQGEGDRLGAIRGENRVSSLFWELSNCGEHQTLIVRKLLGDVQVTPSWGTGRAAPAEDVVTGAMVVAEGALSATTRRAFLGSIPTNAVIIFFGSGHYFTVLKLAGTYTIYQANQGRFEVTQAFSRPIPDFNAFVNDITGTDAARHRFWFKQDLLGAIRYKVINPTPGRLQRFTNALSRGWRSTKMGIRNGFSRIANAFSRRS